MTPSTEIEIAAPVFKCQSDEEIFYQRLSEVAGIEKVVTQGEKICISISRQFQNKALKQVGAICDIWNTSYKLGA